MEFAFVFANNQEYLRALLLLKQEGFLYHIMLDPSELTVLAPTPMVVAGYSLLFATHGLVYRMELYEVPACCLLR